MTQFALMTPADAPLHGLPTVEDEIADPVGAYLEALQMFDRLHRLMLDLVKDEFERLRQDDLTPVQALLLYNLGAAEVSAGELRTRGMYQGSNVSYNLKKLVQSGYLNHTRCEVDRRSVRIRVTDKGAAIREIVARLFANHASGLHMSGVLDDPPLPRVNLQLRRIERYWAEQIRYIY